VSIGYRLIYTGPTQTCSGSISVTSNDVSFEKVNGPNAYTTPTAGQSAIQYSGVSQTGSGYFVPEGATTVRCTVAIIPNSINRSTQTYRPEEGIMLVPKHKTNNFKIVDLMDSPACLLGDAATVAGSTGATYYHLIPHNANSGYGPGQSPGVVFYDNDWQSYCISATGLNVDCSYRLETIVCAEYSVQMSGLAAQTAMGRSADKPALFQRAQQMTSQAPVVTSLASGRQ
jgi:hypothetical protein